ncbi:hypothetical protein JOQ06_029128 [Pogonophryne albipinna]|uniref:Uncharacterized protein n=1 Tax=Pogonophryne albipinna TaxID=1090488 RepID=A0AAD6FLP4_9TELE|nr:hypothetical protein JOQ06_029128 [Pogonophryne albipinna]
MSWKPTVKLQDDDSRFSCYRYPSRQPTNQACLSQSGAPIPPSPCFGVWSHVPLELWRGVVTAPITQAVNFSRAFNPLLSTPFICSDFAVRFDSDVSRPPTVIMSCETIRVGRGHQAHCQSTLSSHWRSPLVANPISFVLVPVRLQPMVSEHHRTETVTVRGEGGFSPSGLRLTRAEAWELWGSG